MQQQIVAECEAVDHAVQKAKEKQEIVGQQMADLLSNNDLLKEKLGQIAQKITGAIDPKAETGEVIYVGLENIESNTGRLVGEVKTEYSTIKSVKTCFKKGDVLYGKLRPNLNKVYLAKESGICSTDIWVFRFENEQLAKFYARYFLTSGFNSEVLKGVSGQQLPRTSWGSMQEIKVPKLSLAEQQKLVAAVEALEKQLSESQQIIGAAAGQKQAILKKYL